MEILTLVLTLVLAVTGQSLQTNCSGAVPPEIRGFRLGMSPGDLTDKYKGLRVSGPGPQGQQTLAVTISPNPLGFSGGLINQEHTSIISNVAYPDLAGVDRVELGFVDGRLYSVAVRYEGLTKWRNVENFIAVISPALKLPSTGWVEDEDRDYVRHLNCSKFEVHAKVEAGMASLQLLDPSAPLMIAARKIDAEEKKRSTFKP